MSEAWRQLALALRARWAWSPPPFKRLVTLDAFRSGLHGEARVRFDQLASRFPLQSWGAACSQQDWVESAYVLDVLSRHLPALELPGRGLDVGSKNGAYIPGVATALARPCDFVELDAHRRYLWGSTRRVYGEHLAAHFTGCRFHAADVRALEGPWAVVTWFLPFLTEAPVDAWELPKAVLQPRALLEHVWTNIAPKGQLFIVNQGEREAALQFELLSQLGLESNTRALGRITSPLSPFKRERLGFLVQR